MSNQENERLYEQLYESRGEEFMEDWLTETYDGQAAFFEWVESELVPSGHPDVKSIEALDPERIAVCVKWVECHKDYAPKASLWVSEQVQELVDSGPEQEADERDGEDD